MIGLVALSRQVHGETFEIAERAVSQSALVSRTQDDAGCLVGLECFLPARCAYASARYQGEASSDGRFAGADAPVFGVLSPRHIHSKPGAVSRLGDGARWTESGSGNGVTTAADGHTLLGAPKIRADQGGDQDAQCPDWLLASAAAGVRSLGKKQRARPWPFDRR